ncbi:Oidioi.mRNA.OKI2018_I69.XSR.g14114.t1.cds [Oikopleura dioica]|uniref:Oidioi.mRNA.OKI2018_I69.XSR.g14114.t1.cds n=1 Tax=Oikopleura dioica TaxID=34765 RepID=A0ABN7S9E4_OIKDI|nr:Oidioi.mRNA.OKI2018_I69.XSR.g14114.t1.cds [Oikopleura dioica]
MQESNLTLTDTIIQKYCDLHVLFSEGEDLIPTPPEDLFYSVLYIVLFIVGFLANIIVIVTLVNHRHVLITSAHLYVLHLSIADFIFLLNIPLATRLHPEQWPFRGIIGEVLCYVHRSAATINFIVSIGLLTTLAVDRYLVLVKNAWKTVRTKSRPPMLAHLYVAGIWLFSLLLATPNMMATSYSETNDTAKCSVNWTLMDAWLPEYPKNSELALETQGNVSFYVYDDESLYLQNLTHEDPLYFGFSDLGSFGNESDLLEMFGGTTEEENELLEEAGWINNTDRCREFIKQANEQYENSISDAQMYHLEQTYSYCSVPEPRSRKIWLWVLFISCCVIPAFVMIFCYTRFWFRVKKVTRDVQNFQNSKRRNKMDSTRRLAILVAVLCSSFFLCWTPFHVFHIFRATGISVNSTTCATLRDVLSTMAYVNACLNPILYSFIGARFRDRARSVLLEKPLQLKRKMSTNISEGNTQLTRFSSNRASFAYNSSRLSDSSRASSESSNSKAFQKGSKSTAFRSKSVPIPEETSLLGEIYENSSAGNLPRSSQ